MVDLERLSLLQPGQLMRALGLTDHTQLCRLRQRGLTEHQADHFASALGFHPAEIWPSWLDGVA